MTEPTLWQKLLHLMWFTPAPQRGPRPGTYHYERLKGDWPTRFHLRVDDDGAGVLLANAAEAAFLSPSGVIMAKALLEDATDEQVLADVSREFTQASLEEIAADVERVRRLIADLQAPGDNYPVSNLDDPYATSQSAALRTPLRADVVPGSEDTTVTILRSLWDAGIPHVTFVPRSATDRDALPRLVEAAGDLGMITGIRSVASWLSDGIVRDAAMKGLDHLDLVIASADAAEHDGLLGEGDHARALALFTLCHDLELCPVAEVPLIRSSSDELDTLISMLQGRGLTNVSFFAIACADDCGPAQEAGALPATALPQMAATIMDASERANVRYLWEPPVLFDRAKSLAEQLTAGPRASGDTAVRVDADGSVFPARGPRAAGGNITRDSWQAIWNSASFTRYRDRLRERTNCPDCPGLAICAADCPKDIRGWSDDSTSGANG